MRRWNVVGNTEFSIHCFYVFVNVFLALDYYSHIVQYKRNAHARTHIHTHSTEIRMQRIETYSSLIFLITSTIIIY